MPQFDINDALRISKKHKVSPLAASILCARGFSFEDAESFLNTDDSVFHNPFLMNDMHKAVERIRYALDNNEKIAIYGDYDVDGITATYILYDYLSLLGADVTFYIPDREDEGYGMNTGAIDYLHKLGIKLIITVDVGITAACEVDYASSLGIDTVVTDHHTLKEKLPDAVAVINPKIKSGSYPYDSLAGVGVAFKLICALSGMDKNIFDRYCPIAAIGTIADMVPLKDENRYIASYGVKMLRETQNIGLKALISVAGIDITKITSTDVSFSIAPRLNAAGRISHASESVLLLLETNPDTANERAVNLDNCNRERQKEEQIIFDEAMGIIEAEGLKDNNFIMVSGKGWAHGVIGIVSSKITEKFYRPSAVVSINEDGTGKASGRSIRGINLFEALSSCSSALVRFGGHELAAGFTVQSGKLTEFYETINKYIGELSNIDDATTPTLDIDACINLEDINMKTVNSLAVLEPYGMENKVPMFCIEDVKIVSIQYTQNAKHAFVTVTRDGIARDLPAFSMAETIRNFAVGDYISVAGTLGTNCYRGSIQPQFIIRDIKYSKLCETITRNELAEIFSSIRNRMKNGKQTLDENSSISVTKNRKLKLRNPKIKIALDVFSELKILNLKEINHGYCITEGENFKIKTELTNSKTFIRYSKQN